MIATEICKGQGLGNQLACYVTTRCIALKNNYKFGIIGAEHFANNIHSECGLYFMNLDFGEKCEKDNFNNIYHECDDRLFVPTSIHDATNGCYVGKMDNDLFEISDSTIVYGNMQAEGYFLSYKEKIKEWLKVNKQYDTYKYSNENTCVIHLRCGDFTGSKELFLNEKYWHDGIDNMLKINPQMNFIVITNDVNKANQILPNIKAINSDLATDYCIIKNAYYFLSSNSSFSYFPILTSETIRTVIAPKYWARHNVSDGYWASEQNIFAGYLYQDREGLLFSDVQCREELKTYKQKTSFESRINNCSNYCKIYVIYKKLLCRVTDAINRIKNIKEVLK